MSDPSVSNVGKASPDLGGYSGPEGTARGHSAAEQSVTAKGKNKGAAGLESSGGKVSDLNLRFMVDSQTKDVTILVVDRSSKKVVRTIPPEEASKLDPGELLQLFA